MIKDTWKQWKRRWLPYIIAYGGKYSLKLLLSTCKVKVDGIDNFLNTAKSSPCIIMLWHNKLVIVSEILINATSDTLFTCFISKSRDGEPLAILAESYSRGKVLRVPHDTRHVALTKLIDTLKEQREVVLVTPDGPRGPTNIVKPGIAVAARESSAAIVPFSWSAKSYWQLKTWDKMKIPKPFTTIHVGFGQPIRLHDLDNTQQDTTILTDALHDLENSLK